MTKKCELTGVLPLKGHNVSHANNKTKRRFLPNLQMVSFFSEKLNRKVKLKVSTRGIKSVEHNGGIDNYVLGLKSKDHTPQTLGIKKDILSVKD